MTTTRELPAMTGPTPPVLYDAVVSHTRSVSPKRAFSHRLYYWLVDLDDLPRLPRAIRPFARFQARDHLGDSERTIRENLDSWLALQGVELRGGRVWMLTHARTLGHVFNPITVYWCFSPEGDVVCVVAEVHNTYGERHCYLLRPDAGDRASFEKDFYVSPFLDLDGCYTLRAPVPGDRLAVSIVLRRADEVSLVATLRGSARPATEFASLLIRYPLVTVRTVVLIRFHGIALVVRRARLNPRPRRDPQEGVG